MKSEKDKKLALFRCCMSSFGPTSYESSLHAVLKELGIKFIEIKEFNCCGYPLRNLSLKAYLISSARDLALGEKRDADLLTFCNRCYGSLNYAKHLMLENGATRDEINEALRKEGLNFEGKSAGRHFIEVINSEIGIGTVRRRIKRNLSGLKVAIHYGCHLLRPKKITGEVLPPLFDSLVDATGAEIASWAGKSDCCGSPLVGINDELSADLAIKKFHNAAETGADYICVTCPYCQIQLGRVQEKLLAAGDESGRIGCILLTQLLGWALGIDAEELGLDEDRLPALAPDFSEVSRVA